MNIKIMSKDGITLKTKDTYIREDISVAVDDSLMGITPTGTYEVVENGEYDITEYAKVNVNVPTGGGGDTSQESDLDKFVERTLTEYRSDRVTTIREYSFYYCCSLISVYIPFVTTINDAAFYGCELLTSVYTANLTKITYEVFANCYRLKALIIHQENSVCTLYNKNAFTNCYHILGLTHSKHNPTGAKDGYIYVPDSKVDSYKSATNWSNYADQIKPLSELPQEYITN